LGLSTIVINDNKNTYGIFASMGYEPHLLSWLNFRAEVNQVAYINGKTWGELQVGLVIGY
jgi:hypothetical protein